MEEDSLVLWVPAAKGEEDGVESREATPWEEGQMEEERLMERGRVEGRVGGRRVE